MTNFLILEKAEIAGQAFVSAAQIEAENMAEAFIMHSEKLLAEHHTVGIKREIIQISAFD